jgi:hypothetical protein
MRLVGRAQFVRLLLYCVCQGLAWDWKCTRGCGWVFDKVLDVSPYFVWGGLARAGFLGVPVKAVLSAGYGLGKKLLMRRRLDEK